MLGVPASEGAWTVFVLAGHSLQKWRLADGEPEKLVFVAELDRMVREGFHAAVWENCAADQVSRSKSIIKMSTDHSF